MSRLDWLVARPVAHRGLHDATRGIIENTGSAFAAAVAGNYAIECDVQISADGEAMVYHDDALGRLTEGVARLDTLTAAELKRVPFKSTSDPMLALGELCELIAGRVTLLVELKSRFDGDKRLVTRSASVLSGYSGPAALMSFNPAPIAALRSIAPKLTRGIVAERRRRQNRDERVAGVQQRLRYLRQLGQSGPQFMAYSVKDLPATIPLAMRYGFRLPLLTWTVRSEADRQTALRWADQMIFEGFRP